MKKMILPKEIHSLQRYKLLKQHGLSNRKINQFKLSYQDKINLNHQFQYGIEIEFVGASLEEVEKQLQKMFQIKKFIYAQEWISEADVSVTNGLYGGEVKSPICYNTEKDWQELKCVCQLIKQLGGYTNDTCSIHLHVDFQQLHYTLDDWERFLKLWCSYEDVLFEFSRVGREKIRPYIVEFALPIKECILTDLKEGKATDAITDIGCYLDKSFCLNMQQLHYFLRGKEVSLPTIEFRSCNGTLEPVLIQNIVRTFTRLLEAVKQNENNLELVIEKRLYEKEPDIYEKMLELSELLFPNEFEQKSFLKQCMSKKMGLKKEGVRI